MNEISTMAAAPTVAIPPQVEELLRRIDKSEEELWEIFLSARRPLKAQRRHPPAKITAYANIKVSEDCHAHLDDVAATYRFLKSKFQEKD